IYKHILCPTPKTTHVLILYCTNYALSIFQVLLHKEKNLLKKLFLFLPSIEPLILLGCCSLYTPPFNRVELLLFHKVLDMRSY
uniref:Uncharacterized protein n=1 Tax=Bos indicus x Bos taurus TaxID=30522 RepID=A0A4W2F2F5_BOBOX